MVVKVASGEVPRNPDESRDMAWKWYVVLPASPESITECEVTRVLPRALRVPYVFVRP